MRKKVELLAPAGSFEALQAAVQNGCDAVYLGGTMFGARAFANNFDKEQMKEAVAYAHVFGVSVYVTVNTLIYDDEMEAALAYIETLQEADVDALIIQDLGLFTRVHERFPDFELHASTQMHIHNPQGIQMLLDMGAKRVVVPRETPIEQIKEYAKLGADLEVFVQGALCVSYSGQCLMSSLTLNRSGNRGECAQPCRMQYTLEEDHHGIHKEVKAKGKYLLSPKDLNTLEEVPSLIDAGIASFKIEGRMKRPEYVALMCRLYRKAIDDVQAGRKVNIEADMRIEMEKIFNRGFTKGHLYQVGSALMNPIRPNHMGVRVGVIEQVTKHQMIVRLVDDLNQGDGVRILKQKEDEGFRVNKIYKNGLLVNGAKKGEKIALDKNDYVEKGSILLKTSDVKQLEQLQTTFDKAYRRVNISASFEMVKGQVATLLLWDEEGHQVSVSSSMNVEKAMKTPLGKERLEAQLKKTKDSAFDITSFDFSRVDEDAIMPIKEINRIRREALEQLTNLRAKRYHTRRVVAEQGLSLKLKHKQETMLVVHTYEQYEACAKAGYQTIYAAEYALYQRLQKEGKHVYLREPRVKKDAYAHEHVLVQENSGLSCAYDYCCDTSLNITNATSAALAFHKGASIVALSLEHSDERAMNLVKTFENQYHQQGNFAMQIYGYSELMISEYCPIQAVLKDDGKKNCGLCRGTTRYDLKDLKGHRYPILTDQQCRMHLLSEKPMDRIAEWPMFQQAHITSPLLIFTIEDAHQVMRVLEKLKEYAYVNDCQSA